MNIRRILVPLGTALLAGGLIVVTGLLPVGTVPAPATPAPARVTTICPSFTGALGGASVAVAGSKVATAPLAAPTSQTTLQGSALLTGDTAIRVITTTGSPAGAVTGAQLAAGPDRGLGLSNCSEPGTTWWFTGLRLNAGAQAELLLVNADSDPAAVDLTVLGAGGRLPAPGGRGITVNPNSQRVVPLGPLVTSDTPISVQLSTSTGRVAAFVRQQEWDGTTPIGSDWVAPAAPPALSQTLTGILGTSVDRMLVITNPGDHTAQVRLGLLSPSGRLGVAGVDILDVPAGVTRMFPLGPALGGDRAGLAISGDVPVTAALIQRTVSGTAPGDVAFAVASTPLSDAVLIPIPLPKSIASTVVVTNAGEEAASVQVTVTDAAGAKVGEQALEIPGGATLTFAVPSVENAQVTLRTAAHNMFAAVTATGTLGDAASATVLPLGSGTVIGDPTRPSYDAHVS